MVNVLDAVLQGRNAPGQQHGVSSDKTIKVVVEDKKFYMVVGDSDRCSVSPYAHESVLY